MKRLLATGCLLLGLTLTHWAQAPKGRVDSLRRCLALAPPDTTRVLLLSRLTLALAVDDGVQSLRYGQQGLALARQLGYGRGEALLLSSLGTSYYSREDNLRATYYYQAAMRRSSQLLTNGQPLVLALQGLGRIAIQQYDYQEGQRYFQQALRCIRSIPPGPGRTHTLAVTYNNLAHLYYSWLTSGQAYPDSIRPLCLRYNRLSLRAIRQESDAGSVAVSLNAMGKAHYLERRYDSAMYYHQAALDVLPAGPATFEAVEAHEWLGAALLAQNHVQEALPLLRMALAEARHLQAAKLRTDCIYKLADALAKADQNKAAYRMARAGQQLTDSLHRAEQRANLSKLRVQFETAQARSQLEEFGHRNRLQQLQTRRQQQYLWWLGSFLLAVAAGLVVSGGLAWRLRRERTQLAAARAEQDHLYALIAHDLRSPVLAFTGLADLLTLYTERQDTARLLGLGGRVRQAAESLRELLDNLLQWALSQRGELRPTPVPLPTAEILADVATLYQPAAEAAGVHLAVASPTDEQVLADRNMTLTILRNLLSNALQATPPGGLLTLRLVEDETDRLGLEVTDTGHGMDAEELARARHPGPGPAASRYRGRARLGLRISHIFAQAQGGQLTLASISGQGTTACLWLPRPPRRPTQAGRGQRG